MPHAPRVLISGGGIAGLTLAYWLHRRGSSPTVIEAAPSIRDGGYMIDFWGLGFDVAERMDLLSALRHAHREIPVLEFVDARDRVTARFPVRKLREAAGWRHFNFLRSELERVLYERIRGELPMRFSTRIAEIRETPSAVDVVLSDGASETYDLVVGADGLRSGTRRMVFGADESFERRLGYCVASFTVDDPEAPPDVFRTHNVPGKQVGIYSVGRGRLAALFVFAHADAIAVRTVEARQRLLADAFTGVGWRARELLEKMNDASDFYLDTVSQIVMPKWHRGRVCLVGDACMCVSLVAGQGSALAMAGAYVLARELARGEGGYAGAFARYRAALAPEIERKQAMALRFASSFVPASRLGIFARDSAVRLMALPWVARAFVRRFLSDDLDLGDAC